MNNHEILFGLLQKETLTEEDKSTITKLIENDKDAENFYKTYIKLSKILKNSSHLSIEQIADYVLFKNGDEPEDKNTAKCLPIIESHLRVCEKCNEEFKNLNNEYEEVNSFVVSKFNEKREHKNIPSKKNYNIIRYAFTTILIIGILYASLFVISRFTMPKYFDLIKSDEASSFYVTRGRVTDDFQKSLNALDDKDYNAAINFLESDIKNYPNDETIFYSYYMLGLVYLNNSESDFIGLFPHYNLENAKLALLNFNSSINKNSSGKFNNIKLDAYFYSAKANLILNNIKEAKKDLNIVVDKKGSKMIEAQDILRKLE